MSCINLLNYDDLRAIIKENSLAKLCANIFFFSIHQLQFLSINAIFCRESAAISYNIHLIELNWVILIVILYRFNIRYVQTVAYQGGNGKWKKFPSAFYFFYFFSNTPNFSFRAFNRLKFRRLCCLQLSSPWESSDLFIYCLFTIFIRILR